MRIIRIKQKVKQYKTSNCEQRSSPMAILSKSEKKGEFASEHMGFKTIRKKQTSLHKNFNFHFNKINSARFRYKMASKISQLSGWQLRQ